MDLIDYNIYYKQKFDDIKTFALSNNWDLFISAFNNSQRVLDIFSAANAIEKHWLVLPEYRFEKGDIPIETPIVKVFPYEDGLNEAEIIVKYFSKITNPNKLNICIDITGFMRPHLIFLVRYLYSLGVKIIDMIYTDPVKYVEGEKTVFTIDDVENVRQVLFCEGAHSSEISNDFLIIGSGYDNKLIASVAENKSHAHKIQLFGLPSLQPDMHQENILKAYKAEESIGGKKFLDPQNSIYSPANDPFVTASVIREFVNKQNKKKKITNLYLSPLSTKPQTLGFALYYIYECIDKQASIIFPYCNHYTRETTEGISKIWKYTVEFPE